MRTQRHNQNLANDSLGRSSSSTSNTSTASDRRFASSGSNSSSGPAKIGRSFEALLASNETWVLKETAEVAEDVSQYPSSGLSTSGERGAPSADGAVRRIISRPAKYAVNDHEDLPSSADARHRDSPLDLTPNLGGQDTRSTPNLDSPSTTTKKGNTSLPVYPGATITRIVSHGQKSSQSSKSTQNYQSMPASSPLPRAPRPPYSSSKPDFQPSAVPPPLPGKDSAKSHSGPDIPNSSAISSLADELGVLAANDGAQQSGSSFKERFKKTGGLFKRFKNASSSGGGSGSQGSGTYSKQSRSAAGASTPSLHHTVGMGNTRRGSTPHAGSLPSSPAATSTQFSARQQQPESVPSVPVIPAQYADSAPVLAASVKSKPGVESSTVRNPPAAGNGGASTGLAGPIELGKANGSADAAAESAPSPPKNIRSSSMHHQSRPSGADLLSKIKAWENEMDDALKGSAHDLEHKTKLSPKATWGPSPELPQLGLGIGLDHAAVFGQRLAPTGSVRSNPTKMVQTSDALRSNRTNEGSSSAPSTPTVQLDAGHIRDERRTASALGEVPADHLKSSAVDQDQDRNPDLAPNHTAPCRSSFQRSTSVPSETSALHPGTRRTPPQPSAGLPIRSSSDKPAREALVTNKPSGLTENGTSKGAIPPIASTQTDQIEASHLPSDARTVFSTGLPRKGHESASAASVVSFETAAEGEGNQPQSRNPDFTEDEGKAGPAKGSGGTTSDGLGLTSGRPGTVQDGEEDDEDDLERHPERSIRVVTTPSSPPEAISTGTVAQGSLSAIEERSLNAAEPSASGRQASPTTALAIEQSSKPAGKINARSTSRGGESDVSPVPTQSTLPSAHDAKLRTASRVAVASPLHSLTSFDSVVLSEARAAAEKCWIEDESWLKKEKIAEWLGGFEPLRTAARVYYFQNFDFGDDRVDMGLRRLCDKLFLRAETQQVDRILEAFSQRFWECNPTPAYGSADNVHAVTFSLLLLNTDLHVADISDRMTRAQFVRNTMSAIADNINDSQQLEADGHSAASGSHSDLPGGTKTIRSTRRDSVGSMSRGASSLSHKTGINGALANRGAFLPDRRQELELDSLLKEMYASVKAHRIRLPMSDASAGPALDMSGRRKNRHNNGPPPTSMVTGSRASQFKRGSIRGIQGLLSSNNAGRMDDAGSSVNLFNFSGSRTVVPEHSSDSSAQSSRPLPSGQTPALGSSSGNDSEKGPNPAGSLGFASMLTHTIIKEAQEEEARTGSILNSSLDAEDEIDDEELALIGAPWAKEGVLTRKHYWDAPSKRAKDKNWVETFVVVQRGTLSIFKFGDTQGNGSGGVKGSVSPLAGAGGFVVGGGNWLSNATLLGEVSLAHCLSNALPPPGYNRARPHVFALTLASGAVYFFQAGTEDLVSEWVATCNYWAARQSKPPLAGGVSNMEYGWNTVLPTSYPDDGYKVSGDGDDEVLNSDAGSRSSHAGDTTTSGTTTQGPGSSGSPVEVIAQQSQQSSEKMSADNRSIRSGQSGRSFGSKAGRTFQNWQDAAQSLNSGKRGGAASISGGNVGVGSAQTLSGPFFRRQAPSIRSFPFGGDSSSSRNSIAGGTGSRIGRGAGVAGNNDRIYINEWKAPTAPTVPSTLKEEEQMELCIAYIARTERELTEHNELRQPMLSLYASNSANRSKALSNWERKSNHLLAELVKWQSYVESLTSAMKSRNDMRDQRQMETALARADEEMAKARQSEEGDPVQIV